MNPDRPKATLLGTLALHANHALVTHQRYIIPPGKVYGSPHLFVHCETDGILIWDEDLFERKS